MPQEADAQTNSFDGTVNVRQELSRTPATGRKTRVLQVGATLAIGGSERLITAIGRGLDPERFEASFAAVGPDGPLGVQLRDAGFSAEALDRRPGFDYRLYAKLWRLIRREKINVVQTHHVTALIYAGLPAKLAGAKLVHTEHDVGSFERYPRNLAWLRRLARLVDRFVAIDPTIGDFFHDRVGIAESRIRVIRNGIDLVEYAPANRPPRSLSADPDREFVIGWVGRMDVPKRPNVLVDAAALFAKTHPTMHVKIVGPGQLIAPTQRRAESAGIADRCEFLGARHDIPDILGSVDCYVLCSDREGLPFTLVEAMATAAPCIASAVGGIPDLIDHGTNGLLLEGNDPQRLANLLDQVFDRPAWAEELGRKGRQAVVDRYDFRKTIDQYAQLFDELSSR